jgi:citrate synthase
VKTAHARGKHTPAETPHRLIGAADAATRLGVKRQTLYAYVSRGLLTAHTRPSQRGSWFDPWELDAIATRARDPLERRPDLRVRSAITLIEGGHYYYRGDDPATLARRFSYEQVAEFLWSGHRPAAPVTWTSDREPVERARAALQILDDAASPTDRLRLIVAMLAADDPLRHDLRPAGAVATGRRLLAATAASIGGRPRGRYAEQVASWLARRKPGPASLAAIEQALSVMADHELAASTFAVRVAASFGADPYAAVSAGLGAVAGTLHGAAGREVEDLLASIEDGMPANQALARTMREGRNPPGFGHPLYPNGDPRGPIVLALARAIRAHAAAGALLQVAARQGVPPPNVDFALAVLARVLNLRRGASEGLFVMGRLAGWIAHAIEEYGERTRLRMRAVYTGPRPG